MTSYCDQLALMELVELQCLDSYIHGLKSRLSRTRSRRDKLVSPLNDPITPTGTNISRELPLSDEIYEISMNRLDSNDKSFESYGQLLLPM